MSGGVARPQRLVVVGGTGTEVGKTWVGCELARHLRGLGQQVSARKLAQSFGPEEGPTDAERLAAATGEKAADVCPPWRWYPRAMAPPMAAEALGLPPFGLDDLVGELRWPPGVDVGLVEWAGGVGSPQATYGDAVDLVERLAPDLVVVVAGAGLGALSNVRLAARALSRHPLAVFLNHFDDEDDLHGRNRRWLAERDGLRVFVSTAGLAEVVVTA
ncbi:MAG: ATP-dependent dethiobiotin synthetase BioD [Acidimicrobiales bacterium]